MAERPLDPADYPDADPALLVPGSIVFRPTRGPVDLDVARLVALRPRRVLAPAGGPGSDTYTRGRHPVTQVAYEDAAAYAAWAGKALPTEAEWERAARGGLDGRRFAWGDEETPDGALDDELLAGRVPVAEHGADGHLGHVAGRRVPAQRLRPLRRDRATCGSGPATVFTDPARTAVAVLRAARRGARPLPEPRDQGRLAPVRAELLPALPAGGAAGRGDRHVDHATSASAASSAAA